MSGKLHLALLGRPQLIYNDAPLTGFISAKAEALLYYLAVTGQLHPRDTLSDLLWGEMPQANARKNLTKALSNLRQLVGPLLTIDYQSAGFNPDGVYWLDTRALQATLEIEEPPLDALRQAADLYRGDFLSGLALKDTPAFEVWLLAEQQRWRDLAQQALERLADRLLARSDDAAAIDCTHRLLALDPYREAAHRQLMTLLARSGQRSAALAHYETCRRLLAEELGVEPAAETQALLARLKAAGPPPHNLPHPSTVFVGRQTELAKVIALLNQPACRLLTIAGPGGIGKTRLALQAAFHYIQPDLAAKTEPPFADGVYWVRLAPLAAASALAPTLAEAVGFSIDAPGRPQQQLLSYLRQKKALLVLDSFEHLLAAPAGDPNEAITLVSQLLEQAPDLKILTTSRTWLNVQGEHLYYLAGLDLPAEPDSPALAAGRLTLAGSGAVQLFLQSARRLQPDFELTPANAADVWHICRLVQGMPLAILLAAPWVELLTPAEIAAEISRSLDFLAADMHDLPDRQRSIRAAFNYSWALLTPREQEVLAQLSIFRGLFSRQAAQTVTRATLSELLALINKSLLRSASGGGYMVHELLRQFAVEKLNQTADEGRAARRRHSAYYLAALQQLERNLKGPAQQAAFSELDAEAENVGVAWNWAVAQAELTGLAQAVAGLGYFYLRRGRYQDGEAAFRLAVDHLTTPATAPEVRLLAQLLAWQGIFSHYLMLSEAASQHLQHSLTMLDSPALVAEDVRGERAFMLWQLGEITREGDRPAARQWLEQSLALYRALDDDWGLANVLASLGWLVQHGGAYDDARRLYEQSLQLRRTLQDQWGVANSLISLSGVVLYQGYPDEAERLVRQSIALRQEQGDRAGLARSLGKWGEALTWLGRFADAYSPFEEGRAIYKNLGLHEAAAFFEAMLGQTDLHRGHYEPARQQAAAALATFQEAASQRGMAYALLVRGWTGLLLTAAPTEAGDWLASSRTIYQVLGQRDELAQVLTLLGYLSYRQADLGQAQQYLRDAWRIAVEIRAFMPMMLAVPLHALLCLAQDKPEPAAQLQALAWRYPFVANSHWFEAVAGRYLTEALASLPASTLAAAQQAGLAQPLETALTPLKIP
ncbi:MAG: tetratricopeptide repeat protein [Anaerolineales bacterium]|nr:tetratricopeptide repeat protein [Anaerolineales bacterium]